MSIILEVSTETKVAFQDDKIAIKECKDKPKMTVWERDEYFVPNKKVIGQTKKNVIFMEQVEKTYGPFVVSLPKLDDDDMYKFTVYTRLKHNFFFQLVEGIGQ